MTLGLAMCTSTVRVPLAALASAWTVTKGCSTCVSSDELLLTTCSSCVSFLLGTSWATVFFSVVLVCWFLPSETCTSTLALGATSLLFVAAKSSLVGGFCLMASLVSVVTESPLVDGLRATASLASVVARSTLVSVVAKSPLASVDSKASTGGSRISSSSREPAASRWAEYFVPAGRRAAAAPAAQESASSRSARDWKAIPGS
mmetsp:Transcript_8377/g.22442  ORF Transcript_8377/g.22442 Transcript_8377/m.22442 type:complete len:203 (+) Transcript_8377:1126-1734(+)